jgi:hypothetical protein
MRMSIAQVRQDDTVGIQLGRVGTNRNVEDWSEPMNDNVFDDLPLLLAVPRAAELLGISRAAAYRLASTGELPVRRLGGRVYVVTSGLRDLIAS